MCYILCMNKDVVYIEPEDDITDIITKIEKTKEKIVALVPPKKAGVMRSIVNIKLIAKAGVTAGKKIVLVTVDPSIVKLAGATSLPVAKDLQSAPVIPALDEDGLPKEKEAVAIEETEPAAEEEAETEKAPVEEEKPEEDDDEDEEKEEKAEKKKAKKAKKAKKGPKLTGNKFLDWIKLHKKTVIFGILVLIALIGVLVWAFVFAPAMDVTVSIKTDARNFAEGITLVEDQSNEDAKDGKVYLEQKKYEQPQEVTFEATGQKNLGEKATGNITVRAKFSPKGGAAMVNSGDTFTLNGHSYTADNSVTLRYTQGDYSVCKGANDSGMSYNDFIKKVDEEGCEIFATVKVTAKAGGTAYNTGPANNGWTTTANVEVYASDTISGGTDKNVTVVQQSDIEKAKAQMNSGAEEENKEKLYESIGDDYLEIESSLEQSTSAITATPGVDQEVPAGTKASLKATTVTSVFVVSKSKLEEYIAAKSNLEEGQKIYEVRDMYLENLSKTRTGYTSRLKAQYFVGPKITEKEVVDKILGKGLGDARREISDLYGVSDVKMQPSYPWVSAVPNDSNKVTVKFEVRDQNGGEMNNKDKNSNSSNSKKESEQSSDSGGEEAGE